MAHAQQLSMMITALVTFLGLSTCATLTIVAAVVLGARRSRVAYGNPVHESAGELAVSRANGLAYGH
jgi:hypothetical protein